MFGFDERYAMFDTTPVDNQFILEYLPSAPGDAVKVYLYGLLRCYHPEEGLSVERMADELSLTADQVEAAFRYWERRQLVRRVSDRPLRWQYVNVKEKIFGGDIGTPDPEYKKFATAVSDIFDKERRLHGSEMSACFEWKEDLKLPTEVIIMLLNRMVQLKGRNFRIADAGKVAMRMADEHVRTVEEAEEFFLRDGQTYKNVREILRRLGKNYPPSEAQVKMYQKWTKDWGFTHEAVLEATALTAKGDPNMGYLDGILNSLRREKAADGKITPAGIRESARTAEELRQILNELGRGDVNQDNIELYRQMTGLYPRQIIRTAARECASSGKGPEDLLKLLQAWKEKGLENEEQVDAYVTAFHDQTALIRELRRIWGADENRVGKTDRSLVRKWENELGFSREMILDTAPLASEAMKPMPYLDRILSDYHARGIATPEEAKAEREKERTGKAGRNKTAVPSVSAQQYVQRPYSGVQEEMMDEQQRKIEAFLHGNGGQSDA